MRYANANNPGWIFRVKGLFNDGSERRKAIVLGVVLATHDAVCDQIGNVEPGAESRIDSFGSLTWPAGQEQKEIQAIRDRALASGMDKILNDKTIVKTILDNTAEILTKSRGIGVAAYWTDRAAQVWKTPNPSQGGELQRYLIAGLVGFPYPSKKTFASKVPFTPPQ